MDRTRDRRFSLIAAARTTALMSLWSPIIIVQIFTCCSIKNADKEEEQKSNDKGWGMKK